MTIEELEIVVTASVEQALKEFQKILPQIKQTVQQAQEAFNKVDMKSVNSKIHQFINFTKQKIQNFKKSVENNKVAMKVNTQDATKQVTQLQKQINSLEKQINARQIKLSIITPKIEEITTQTANTVTPVGLSRNDPAVEATINKTLNSNKEYVNLVKQEEKIIAEIKSYSRQEDIAKSKMKDLGGEIQKTGASQNKLTSFFSTFKNNLSKSKFDTSSLKNIFSQMPNMISIATKNIMKMTSNIKSGLGHVLKYAAALFSIRTIYAFLSGIGNGWLSSQNEAAQQLNANIEYIKFAMGSALAPIIQYITNLVYSLLKAIQSVVYELFRVNIFANASASAFKNAQKQSASTAKQLASVHSEINNVGNHNENTMPNIGDLSKVEALNGLSQKLYDFFKPLKDSWNKYGAVVIEQFKTTFSQVIGLISSIWGSFEKVVINGTIYTTLKLILEIIGNIAQAFSNAWNYNGNGDAIVQNLANAFNNLLGAINNVVKSPGFQDWLNNCSDKFKTISQKISEINWQPLIDALTSIGKTIGTVALDILSGLVSILGWFIEHPDIAIIIASVATSLLLVGKAIGSISGISTIIATISSIAEAFGTTAGIIVSVIGGVIAIIVGIAAAVSSFFSMLKNGFSWLKEIIMIAGIALVAIGAIILGAPALITAIIATIIAAIATAIVVVKEHWETIKETVSNAVKSMGDTISNWINNVKQWFSDMIEKVKTGWTNFWISLPIKMTEIITNIKNTISNWINNVKQAISNKLNDIKNTWNNIWTEIGNKISDVWNGIWNTIKTIINKILGGIESFVNGAIKGINKLLSGISKVANAVGSVLGISSINLQLSTISLPRLATGNVAYSPTIAEFGEYAGASTNPEITAPRSTIYDTVKQAIKDVGASGSKQPINLTINVGNTKLGNILIDDIKDKKRRTGNDIEAIFA